VEQSAVNRILVIISLAIASPTALGYLGPGVGGGAIATVLGFLGQSFSVYSTVDQFLICIHVISF
jgi:hypothetical protein